MLKCFYERCRSWWTGMHDCPRCGVLVLTSGDGFCLSCEDEMQTAWGAVLTEVRDQARRPLPAESDDDA